MAQLSYTADDIVDAMFDLVPALGWLKGWQRDKSREDMRRRVTDILEEQCRERRSWEDDEC